METEKKPKKSSAEKKAKKEKKEKKEKRRDSKDNNKAAEDNNNANGVIISTRGLEEGEGHIIELRTPQPNNKRVESNNNESSTAIERPSSSSSAFQPVKKKGDGDSREKKSKDKDKKQHNKDKKKKKQATDDILSDPSNSAASSSQELDSARDTADQLPRVYMGEKAGFIPIPGVSSSPQRPMSPQEREELRVAISQVEEELKDREQFSLTIQKITLSALVSAHRFVRNKPWLQLRYGSDGQPVTFKPEDAVTETDGSAAEFTDLKWSIPIERNESDRQDLCVAVCSREIVLGRYWLAATEVSDLLQQAKNKVAAKRNKNPSADVGPTFFVVDGEVNNELGSAGKIQLLCRLQPMTAEDKAVPAVNLIEAEVEEEEQEQEQGQRLFYRSQSRSQSPVTAMRRQSSPSLAGGGDQQQRKILASSPQHTINNAKDRSFVTVRVLALAAADLKAMHLLEPNSPQLQLTAGEWIGITAAAKGAGLAAKWTGLGWRMIVKKESGLVLTALSHGKVIGKAYLSTEELLAAPQLLFPGQQQLHANNNNLNDEYSMQSNSQQDKPPPVSQVVKALTDGRRFVGRVKLNLALNLAEDLIDEMASRATATATDDPNNEDGDGDGDNTNIMAAATMPMIVEADNETDGGSLMTHSIAARSRMSSPMKKERLLPVTLTILEAVALEISLSPLTKLLLVSPMVTLHAACGAWAAATSPLQAGDFCHWIDIGWTAPILTESSSFRVTLWAGKRSVGSAALTASQLLALPTDRSGRLEIFLLLRDKDHVILPAVATNANASAPPAAAVPPTDSNNLDTSFMTNGQPQAANNNHYLANPFDATIMGGTVGGSGNNNSRAVNLGRVTAKLRLTCRFDKYKARPLSPSKQQQQQQQQLGSDKAKGNANGNGSVNTSPARSRAGSAVQRKQSAQSQSQSRRAGSADGNRSVNTGAMMISRVTTRSLSPSAAPGGGGMIRGIVPDRTAEEEDLSDEDEQEPLSFPLILELQEIALVDLLAIHTLAANQPMAQLVCDRKMASTPAGRGSVARWTGLAWVMKVRADSELTITVMSRNSSIGSAHIAPTSLLSLPATAGGLCSLSLTLRGKGGASAGRAVLTMRLRSSIPVTQLDAQDGSMFIVSQLLAGGNNSAGVVGAGSNASLGPGYVNPMMVPRAPPLRSQSTDAASFNGAGSGMLPPLISQGGGFGGAGRGGIATRSVVSAGGLRQSTGSLNHLPSILHANQQGGGDTLLKAAGHAASLVFDPRLQLLDDAEAQRRGLAMRVTIHEVDLWAIPRSSSLLGLTKTSHGSLVVSFAFAKATFSSPMSKARSDPSSTLGHEAAVWTGLDWAFSLLGKGQGHRLRLTASSATSSKLSSVIGAAAVSVDDLLTSQADENGIKRIAGDLSLSVHAIDANSSPDTNGTAAAAASNSVGVALASQNRGRFKIAYSIQVVALNNHPMHAQSQPKSQPAFPSNNYAHQASYNQSNSYLSYPDLAAGPDSSLSLYDNEQPSRGGGMMGMFAAAAGMGSNRYQKQQQMAALDMATGLFDTSVISAEPSLTFPAGGPLPPRQQSQQQLAPVPYYLQQQQQQQGQGGQLSLQQRAYSPYQPFQRPQPSLTQQQQQLQSQQQPQLNRGDEIRDPQLRQTQRLISSHLNSRSLEPFEAEELEAKQVIKAWQWPCLLQIVDLAAFELLPPVSLLRGGSLLRPCIQVYAEDGNFFQQTAIDNFNSDFHSWQALDKDRAIQGQGQAQGQQQQQQQAWPAFPVAAGAVLRISALHIPQTQSAAVKGPLGLLARLTSSASDSAGQGTGQEKGISLGEGKLSVLELASAPLNAKGSREAVCLLERPTEGTLTNTGDNSGGVNVGRVIVRARLTPITAEEYHAYLPPQPAALPTLSSPGPLASSPSAAYYNQQQQQQQANINVNNNSYSGSNRILGTGGMYLEQGSVADSLSNYSFNSREPGEEDNNNDRNWLMQQRSVSSKPFALLSDPQHHQPAAEQEAEEAEEAEEQLVIQEPFQAPSEPQSPLPHKDYSYSYSYGGLARSVNNDDDDDDDDEDYNNDNSLPQRNYPPLGQGQQSQGQTQQQGQGHPGQSQALSFEQMQRQFQLQFAAQQTQQQTQQPISNLQYDNSASYVDDSNHVGPLQQQGSLETYELIDDNQQPLSGNNNSSSYYEAANIERNWRQQQLQAQQSLLQPIPFQPSTVSPSQPQVQSQVQPQMQYQQQLTGEEPSKAISASSAFSSLHPSPRPFTAPAVQPQSSQQPRPQQQRMRTASSATGVSSSNNNQQQSVSMSVPSQPRSAAGAKQQQMPQQMQQQARMSPSQSQSQSQSQPQRVHSSHQQAQQQYYDYDTGQQSRAGGGSPSSSLASSIGARQSQPLPAASIQEQAQATIATAAQSRSPLLVLPAPINTQQGQGQGQQLSLRQQSVDSMPSLPLNQFPSTDNNSTMVTTLMQTDDLASAVRVTVAALALVDLPAAHTFTANCPSVTLACGKFSSSLPPKNGAGRAAAWEQVSDLSFLFDRGATLRTLVSSKDKNIGFCNFSRARLLSGRRGQSGSYVVIGELISQPGNKPAGKIKLVYDLVAA